MPFETVELLEAAGRVEEILFEEGNQVKAGDVLVKLDESLMQAELKDLQAQLEGEQSKAATMKSQITEQTAALQAEIDAIKPEREQLELFAA